MLVKDFFKNVGNLFIENEKFIDFLPTPEDYEILNVFFVDKYATVSIDYDEEAQTLEDMQKITYLAIVKRLDYYKAINDSIKTTYNPVLESVNIETTRTKSGDDKITASGTDTTKTTGGITSTTTNESNTFDNAAYRESDKITNKDENNVTNEFIHGAVNTTVYNTTDKETVKGHNYLNYAEVLKDMYEAKKINLYDVIINDVADDICNMIYNF